MMSRDCSGLINVCFDADKEGEMRTFLCALLTVLFSCSAVLATSNCSHAFVGGEYYDVEQTLIACSEKLAGMDDQDSRYEEYLSIFHNLDTWLSLSHEEKVAREDKLLSPLKKDIWGWSAQWRRDHKDDFLAAALWCWKHSEGLPYDPSAAFYGEQLGYILSGQTVFCPRYYLIGVSVTDLLGYSQSWYNLVAEHPDEVRCWSQLQLSELQPPCLEQLAQYCLASFDGGVWDSSIIDW
ncbi:hypothetical protein KKI23_03710 [Patescibacteria group bacterium]|nr:hypothetical protein [Patescibacteria group bacterium]